MADHNLPPRPATPQVLLHRMPDRPSSSEEIVRAPSKYIITIEGSIGEAGKVHIADSVAKSLSCPLYLGDSVHESSAKAASVGTVRSVTSEAAVDGSYLSNLGIGGGQMVLTSPSGLNEARYQRMWLSKLTRTGLLFPDESRPAIEGITGFDGSASTSTSRRGSVSSVVSMSSYDTTNLPSSVAQLATSSLPPAASAPRVTAAFTIPEEERLRRANPALMVLTHPELDPWHKLAIRTTIRDYGIGIIFAPLHEKSINFTDDQEQDEEDISILQRLDPRKMTSFLDSSVPGSRATSKTGRRDGLIELHIDLNVDTEGITSHIFNGARSIMGS